MQRHNGPCSFIGENDPQLDIAPSRDLILMLDLLKRSAMCCCCRAALLSLLSTTKLSPLKCLRACWPTTSFREHLEMLLECMTSFKPSQEPA